MMKFTILMLISFACAGNSPEIFLKFTREESSDYKLMIKHNGKDQVVNGKTLRKLLKNNKNRLKELLGEEGLEKSLKLGRNSNISARAISLIDYIQSNAITPKKISPQFEVNCRESPERYPVLTLKSGEQKSIPPQKYRFQEVNIESGATLRIKKSRSSWLFLDVVGDVNLQGKIVYEGVPVTEDPIELKLPNGKIISHQFPVGIGGRGGNGLSLGVSGKGGVGSDGSTVSGGGGGGGGYREGSVYMNRDNGKGASGGQRSNRGGAGGEKTPTNGGLIFIKAGGNFNGEGGEIHASGTNGVNGSSGGSPNDHFYSSPAGGGGGSPGGNGGMVYLQSETISGYSEVLNDGGAGGKGGKGGRQKAGGRRSAESGEDGKQGEGGDFLFYP